MTQDGLLLVGMAIIGVYAVGWTRRLAPAWSELPLKTLLATGLAVGAVLLELSGAPLAAGSRRLIAITAAAYVLAPLVVTAAARARAYVVADLVTAVLYWTQAGRDGVRRLVVQAALQQGDGTAALERLPLREGEAMRAQALAADERWDEVLAVEVPESGDAAHLASLARVEALLALGRGHEAEHEARAMRARWERGPQTPIGFRSVTLAEARIDAERGAFERVRQALSAGLPGVGADVLYGIVGRSAERAGERDVALRLYAEAYRTAPTGRRERYARPLRDADEPLPTPVRRRAGLVTLASVAVLAALFAGQLALDAAAGTFGFGRFAFLPSQVAAAFVLGFPGFPDGEAAWRYLSYAFVHGGWVHIGFNMWVLFDIGRMYEARRGGGNLLAAFVVGAVMGAYLTAMAQAGQQVVLVGASGGVLGVAGALLADVLRSGAAADRSLLRGLVQWMVLIGLLSVAIPNVSLWGHVGGVVGGALWGFVRQGLPAGPLVDRVAGFVALAALAAAFSQAARVASGLL